MYTTCHRCYNWPARRRHDPAGLTLWGQQTLIKWGTEFRPISPSYPGAIIGADFGIERNRLSVIRSFVARLQIRDGSDELLNTRFHVSIGPTNSVGQ